jgi:anti-anti-sigma factor
MSKSEILYAHNGTHIIKLVGDIRLHTSKPLNDFYNHFLKGTKIEDLIIDTTEVEGIDSTGLGLLAQLAIAFMNHTNKKAALVCVSKSIYRILTAVHFDELFLIVNKPETPVGALESLAKHEEESETEMAQRALEAHRILASLSDANKKEFQPVVEFLEKELKGKS